MHYALKDLSPALRGALESVGYRRADIRVIPQARVDAGCAGGDGIRGFACFVNLDTGERRTSMGSYGGANIFAANAVDGTAGGTMADLPPNGALISGHSGGGQPVWATVYAHPDAFGTLLPAPPAEDALTDVQRKALVAYYTLKGGEYRREELRRIGAADADTDALVDGGYLKRNRAGAISITTAGKNMAASERGY